MLALEKIFGSGVQGGQKERRHNIQGNCAQKGRGNKSIGGWSSQCPGRPDPLSQDV